MPRWLLAVTFVLFVGVLFSAMKPDSWAGLAFIGIASPTLLLGASHVAVRGRLTHACALSGEVSYPIYVIHWPVMAWMGTLTSGMTPGVRCIVTMAVLVPASFLASRMFDIPLRRALRRLPILRRAYRAKPAPDDRAIPPAPRPAP